MKLIATTHKNPNPKGKVRLSGAKNSATRLMAAALLCDEDVTLTNFPTALIDVQNKAKYIEQHNGYVNFKSEDEISISAKKLTSNPLENYFCPVRTTYLFVAGLLKKTGIARIPYPEGCVIGKRGYDLHVMVWRSFGAKVTEHDTHIEITIPNLLNPAIIEFPISTIGGTENALMCASFIQGTTTIKNAYISPEVEDLIAFLIATGVSIEVKNTTQITIKGVQYQKGVSYSIIPDRIEAVTWIVYAAITNGNIYIENVPVAQLEAPIKLFNTIGLNLIINESNVHVKPLTNKKLTPFKVDTGKYPDIISDMQPFVTLLGLFAEGESHIYDYRYPKRTQYCKEIEKLYPKQIKWKLGHIIVNGKSSKYDEATEKVLTATDLRGAMAILLAALTTKHSCKIYNAELILRGYNKLEQKLKALGIHVEFTEL